MEKTTNADVAALRNEINIALEKAKMLITTEDTGKGILIIQEIVEALLTVVEDLSAHNESLKDLKIHDPANKSSSFDFEGTEKTASNNDQDKEDDDLQLKVEKCIRKLDSGRNWDEVVGQGTAKAALEEALVLPFSFPWYYEGKISPPQGVLLYGPPGVGKTKLAEIAASTSNSQLVEIRGSDVRSKYYGESEKFIRVLFRRILELKRAVIFIDEIDGLLPRKGESNSKLGDGIVNEFLVQLQGNPSLTQHRFVLIGATNYPQYIDIAIMRRFQKLVRLSLPDVADRIKLFKTRLQPVNPPFGDVDYRRFATMTEGYSGSDIFVIADDALMGPLRKVRMTSKAPQDSTEFREAVECVSITIFDVHDAIKKKMRTVSKDTLRSLDEFDESRHVHGNVSRVREGRTTKQRLGEAIIKWFV